jgi:hypothetical protein
LRFYEQLLDRLDQLPGVRGATFARVQLIANDNFINDFLLPGETAETATDHDETMRQMVRENYFADNGDPVLRGRGFTLRDDQHAPAVGIVNQTFQQKFFPSGDVVGKRITNNYRNRQVEIVGVVADTKYESQRDEIKPLLYTPWKQEAADIGDMHFAVRTTGDPPLWSRRFAAAVHTLDSNLPVTDIDTQSARSEMTLAQERLYRASVYGVWCTRARARRYRTFRSVGIFRQSTNKRDWDSDGVRRSGKKM